MQVYFEHDMNTFYDSDYDEDEPGQNGLLDLTVCSFCTGGFQIADCYFTIVDKCEYMN